MSQPKTITILGAGMMGSALAFPARENGHTVRLVGTPLDTDIIAACRQTNRHPKFTRDFPAGVQFLTFDQFHNTLADSDLLICGVSSFGVEWFADTILPLIPQNLPVLSVTKGLIANPNDNGNLVSYPEYWQQRSPKPLSINAIGGPCTSYELVFHDQTLVTFCGQNLQTLQQLRNLLTTDYYHIALSTDLRGVEASVALKNAYAYGVCITVGALEKIHGPDCPPHYNSQAGAFTQSVLEMQKLLKLLGAQTDLALATGVGDLYVTVFGGRNRLLGKLIGRGLPLDAALRELSGITLEGNVIVQRIVHWLRQQAAANKLNLNDFPLIAHLGEILLDNAPANLPWQKFATPLTTT